MTAQIRERIREVLDKIGCLNASGSLQDRLIRTLEYQDEIRKAAEDVTQILDEIEFVLDYAQQVKYCPTCEEPEDKGHLPHCALAIKKERLKRCLRKMIEVPYDEAVLQALLDSKNKTSDIAYTEDDDL